MFLLVINNIICFLYYGRQLCKVLYDLFWKGTSILFSCLKSNNKVKILYVFEGSSNTKCYMHEGGERGGDLKRCHTM